MNVVSLIYDVLNSQVQGQIVRDLLALKSYDPFVNTKDIELYGLLDALGIAKTDQPPSLKIIYRVTNWPAPMPTGTLVKRDLKPSPLETKIDPNPQIGYYLTEQGRSGANLTERYLNKNAPRGRGIVDPMILQVWG